MKMRLPSLLLASATLCIAQSERNNTADVHAFVAKYRAMNDTEDVLDGLERIGEGSKELFDLGRSIGPFFSAMVNTTFEEDTAEVLAMLELASLVKSYELNREDLDDFNLNVNGGISPIFGIMEQLIAEFVRGDGTTMIENIQKFRALAKIEDEGFPFWNVMGQASNMDKYVRTNCRLPTKTMIENMIRIREAIRKVNLRISPETVNDIAKVPDGNGKAYEIKNEQQYKMFMDSVVRSMAHASTEEVHKFEENLDRIRFPTYNLVAVAADKSSRYISGSMSEDEFNQMHFGKCILTEYHAVRIYDKTAQISKMRELYTILLRIELLEIVLSSVGEPDEQQYRRNAEESIQSIARTGKYMAKWSRQFQELQKSLKVPMENPDKEHLDHSGRDFARRR